MCRLLGVSSSGFYDWLGRPVSVHERENAQLLSAIKHSHEASDGTYGSPRVVRDLIDAGFSCSKNRVARLMKAAGIKAVISGVGHQASLTRQSMPSRRICWTGNLKRQGRIKNGPRTLPTYGPAKAGFCRCRPRPVLAPCGGLVDAADDDGTAGNGCPADGYLPSRPSSRSSASFRPRFPRRIPSGCSSPTVLFAA